MQLRKRFLSFTLIFLLTFSLIPAAEAKTGTLVSNTGTRHVVCTSLSSQANAYYTGSNTYDAVSALSASSSDPMSSAMFNRLHTLMTSTMTNSVSYGSLRDYWPKTDANNGSSNPILFYSDALSGNYNREHVWPKSRASFYQSNGGSDLHHLRPTNDTINSTRGNMTMGNVKGVYSSYSTKAYDGRTVLWYNTEADIVEVNDNIKGDVARILLYVWCRWQEPNLYENDPDPVIGSGDDANNGLKVIESRETLLQWMELDPVDTWEMSRNDQCENVQGNRNVFIDYPEYAWLLFGLVPPSDYPTPSGEAMNATSFSFTAAANNAAWGSVSVSGRTITATPNTGYYVADATVSPAGAATLTRDGNTFTVSNQTADCAVTVNFAAKTVLTVSFAANGGTGTMASREVYAGEPFTLPACGFTAPDGKLFAGWKWSVDNAVYQPNASVTVNANSTFTAQWAEPSDDATYVLVETAPTDWSGDYLIVYTVGPYAMDGSLTTLDAISNYKTVSINGKTITVDADENDFYFTIAQSGSNYTVKSASGYYIGQTSNANGLSASNTTQYTNTLSLSGTDANIVSSGGAYLRFNNQSGQTRFRYYKSGSYTGQKAVSLYKRVIVTPPEPQATPAFKTQSLLLDGQIGVNFYLDLPEIDGVDYDESYMTFAISGKGTTTERDDFDANDMNASGKYYCFTCYVNSVQMADTITATFHFGSGQTVEKTYSVLEYFLAFDETVAAHPDLFDAKTQALIRSVADFGHYMQPFLAAQNGWAIGTDHAKMDKVYTTDYDTDAIADAVADSAFSFVNNGANIARASFTLELKSATTIRLLLKPTSGYTGTFTVTAGGETYTPEMSSGWYHVDIVNVAAHQLSTPYTVVVTTEDGSAEITLSAMTYVNVLLANSTDAASRNAASALWAYSHAADAFKKR